MLEDFLNIDRKEYTVFNVGMLGFNIRHIYNMLRDEELMSQINPNILVLSSYWNTLTQYDNNILIEAIEYEFLRNILKNSSTAFFAYRGFLFIKYGELLGQFQSMSLYVDKICSQTLKKRIIVILIKEPMLLNDKGIAADA